MRQFNFDVETFSAIDLSEIGSYHYARHPSTDLRCVSYCLIKDGVRDPIETWLPGDAIPAALSAIADDPDTLICAFNINFDGQILEQILGPRYGWPVIPRERWRCAQAAALARALPASLDAAAAALKLEVRKDKKGAAVMRQLAGPRPQTPKERKAGKPLDFTATADEMAVLIKYNKIDVLIMMEIVDRVGLLSPSEQVIWHLDQVVNARGVHMDVPLLDTALEVIREAKIEIGDRLAELTGGAVTTPQQTKRILKFLAEHGCRISNLQKGTVADVLLEPNLAGPARQLLELRQGGAGAAPSKLPTLKRWTDPQDHRIRHAYRYHGASSGRFTSLGCQLHNLKKPEMENIAGAIEALATGSLAEIRGRGFDRPLEMIGQLARAFPTPAPGKRFFIADLSGIEARGAASICGDLRELEQWRTFDRTGRPEDEPYYIAGIQTFHQPPKTARKAGKTGQLGFQYQGGVGAYRRITGDVTTDDDTIQQRKIAWRNDHPLYDQFWRLSIFQAVQAIRHPGMEFSAKAVSFKYDNNTGFLELKLPSGRALTYPAAELFEDQQFDSVSFTFLDASLGNVGKMYHERRNSGAFGGLILENATQALCRDIFTDAMLRLEAAGYSIVMHTHDDFVCEVPADFGSFEEFLSIITTPPAWAPDLPIAAKGRIADRFIEIPEPARAAAVIVDNVIANALEEFHEEADDIARTETLDELADKVATPEPGTFEPEEIAPLAEIMPEAPAPAPEPVHACGQCHLTPDGSERPNAYEGVWLHDRCEDAFIQARMLQEGVPWTVDATPSTPTSAPPATNGHAAGNGRDADAAELMALLQPDPLPRGSGDGNGYCRGESAGGSPQIAEYIYRTADKRMHTRVVRTAAKTFPTYHWVDGAWAAGWPDKVVPYRLPELLAAPADAIALICEGEKDCDTAARYGFTATTNPGGAEKWQPELTQYFKGKQRVVIVQDNDEPGAKHTAAITRALKGIVPLIGVVRFPELSSGGDLSDYFDAGGTKPYLQKRIDEALKAGATPSYALVSLDAVPLQAQHWLWRGHYPIGALEMVAGEVGLGKGLLSCDMISRATRGAEWPDGSPNTAGAGHVIVLTAEDRLEDYRRRCAASGADPSKVKFLEGVIVEDRHELFTLARDLSALEDACLRLGDVRLVVIDPITAFMGSGKGFDSHRATDVRAQLYPLSKLAERLNVAFSVITHPPKGAANRSPLDNFIGSQAFIAAARVGHYCIAETGEEDDRGFRRPTGRVFFTTIKRSHSAPPPTLLFQREIVRVAYDAEADEWIEAPRIVWEPEPSHLSAEEAIAANREQRGDLRKARSAPIKEFLRDILITAGVPVLQKIIVERGALKGFTIAQLHRARRAIGAAAFKQRGENLTSPWLWAMPEHVPASAEKAGDDD